MHKKREIIGQTTASKIGERQMNTENHDFLEQKSDSIFVPAS